MPPRAAGDQDSGSSRPSDLALVVQQPGLRLEAAAEADEAAVAADDAVARHDDRQWVAPVRRADRPGLAVVAEAAGLLAVADRLAVRDRRQPPPRLQLERRAERSQRQVERLTVAVEVLAELRGRRRRGRARSGHRVRRRRRRSTAFGKRISCSSPAAATSVSGPIGLSIVWWQRGHLASSVAGAPAIAHRWCKAYERHGRHRSARSGPIAEAGQADAYAEIRRQEHVRVAEPAHQHVAGRPRADAGDRTERRRPRRPGRRRRRGRDVRRRPGTPARRSCGRRLRGIGNDAGSTAASAAGDGNTWLTGPPSMASGAPTAATMRPATVRAPATEICWPMTARTAVSNGSTLPGTRRPGAAATDGASVGSSPSAASTATGSASRSSSRRTRRTAGPRSRQSASRRSTRTFGRPARPCRRREQDGDAVAVREVECAVERLAVPGLDARHGARGEERHERRSASNGSRTARSSSTAPAPRAGTRPAAARRADGVAPNTRRTVSLNWRTLPNPAAKAMDVKSMSVVSMRMRAVWARWALAMASGPAPSSSVRSRVEVALAVGEPAGQAADALAVDDAVDDEAHRPGDDVAADVPLRRAGRGVGAAALAGAVAALLGGRRGREELDVARLGRHGRAARPAVHAGGRHGGDEPPVEPAVAALHGAVAAVVVEHRHRAPSWRRGRAGDQRESDIHRRRGPRVSRRQRGRAPAPIAGAVGRASGAVTRARSSHRPNAHTTTAAANDARLPSSCGDEAEQEPAADGADLEEHRERADRRRPLSIVDAVDGEGHQRGVHERHADADHDGRAPQRPRLGERGEARRARRPARRRRSSRSAGHRAARARGRRRCAARGRPRCRRRTGRPSRRSRSSGRGREGTPRTPRRRRCRTPGRAPARRPRGG